MIKFFLKPQTVWQIVQAVFNFIKGPKSMAERSMKFALDNLKPLSHFKGQYMFKEKFNPEWVNKYLIYDSEYDLINFPAAFKAVSKV